MHTKPVTPIPKQMSDQKVETKGYNTKAQTKKRIKKANSGSVDFGKHKRNQLIQSSSSNPLRAGCNKPRKLLG